MPSKFLELLKTSPEVSDGTEEPFKLSLEDMASELSITPADYLNSTDLVSTSPIQPPKTPKSFLMQRYTLLATPLFTIYIQGVLPIKEDTSLSFFLINSTLKINGHPLFKTNPSLCESLVEKAIELKDNLYSSALKDKHVELIAEISKHVNINPSKCLSKKAAEQTIESYLEDLATFLVGEGFDNPLTWLEKNRPTNSLAALSYEDLKQLSDSIIDF